MKYIILVILAILSILILSGCTNNVPKEYKDNPCADFCYPNLKAVDPVFVNILKEVKSPECRVDENYNPEAFEGRNVTLIKSTSPECNGAGTYCDCKLNNGSYILKATNRDNNNKIYEIN